MTLPPDARPLRPNEVTPALQAAASRIEADPAQYPIGALVDLGDLEPGVVADVSVHTWVGATGEQRPDGIRGTDLWHVGPHAIAAPMHETAAEGIDLSSYQGTPDLAQVVASGRSFAFIRAGDGLTHVDAQFAANWQRAGDVGLLRGAYLFFRASRSSTDQASRFLSMVASAEAQHGVAELPLVLDVETADGIDLPGVAAAVARAVDALVDARFGRPLVYTMPGFWNTLPAGPLAHLADVADLWLAEWGPAAHVPAPWSRWALWQYASTAIVPGVIGRMDVDRFAGTADELRVWAAGGALPPLPPPDITTNAGVQEALNCLGQRPPLVVDGIIGPASDRALRAFQAAAHLPVDGVIDAATRTALAAALAAQASA